MSSLQRFGRRALFLPEVVGRGLRLRHLQAHGHDAVQRVQGRWHGGAYPGHDQKGRLGVGGCRQMY